MFIQFAGFVYQIDHTHFHIPFGVVPGPIELVAAVRVAIMARLVDF